MKELIAKLSLLDSTGWSALAAVVTAVMTVIYTFGTLLLWISTRSTVKILKTQLDNQSKQIKSAANSQIISSHRELFLAILQDEDLSRALFGTKRGADADLIRRRWLGTILINHCYLIFAEHQTGVIIGEFYEFVEDAKDLFSFGIVRSRWEEVRDFHRADFARFIDIWVLDLDLH
ncbi:hypothetical protein [Mesorhizobium sp. M0678]|uniref:hypothetical protein n=1 Tax=Mesorhizobium sp. M0678 TaxID=2956985 RepID=UPI003339AE0F